MTIIFIRLRWSALDLHIQHGLGCLLSVCAPVPSVSPGSWVLRRGDGCGWDNGVVSMEGDGAIALLPGRCLVRRIFLPLLLSLGFPGSFICCFEAT